MVIRFKKGLCFIMAAILLCGLFGCSQKQPHTPYSLCQKIISLCSAETVWKSLDSDGAAAYYGAGKELLENFAAYISDDDTRYDAIAVFTFKNGDEKKAIAQCFAESLKSNKKTAGVVNAAESAKIEQGVVMELEDMLILVIAENSKTVSEELLKIGAKNYSY